MKKSSEIRNRKTDHLEINLHEDVKSTNTTGLEKFRLIHCALPDIDFNEIDTSLMLFGKKLDFPLLISSMTGGTKQGAKYNQFFAEAAEENKIAIGVGSQRIAIEDKSRIASFQIREYAPTTLVFANLGAVQLNYGYSSEACSRAVDMIEADALILHLNPLQEVLMKDGNTNFSDLLPKVEEICKNLSVPVIAKEVGWGINKEIARKLFDAGVSAVDVAGSGGTSWSEVEKFRSKDPFLKAAATGFHSWGIPTAEAVISISELDDKGLVFASGGLESGIDILKCLALGADLCGIARPFLLKAAESAESVNEYVRVLRKQLEVAMFAVGVKTIDDISKNLIVRV